MIQLERILKNIGFTNGETKTYLALAGLGEATVGPIVKQSGISRSKAYDILNKLVKRGVVSSIHKESGLAYRTLPPDALLEYMREKENLFNKEREELTKALPQLRELVHVPEVDVVVYEGFEGFKAMIDRTVNELEKTDCYYAMGIGKTTPAMRHYARKIYEVQRKCKYRAKSIFDQEGTFKIMERQTPLHEIRVLPKAIKTPSLFTVYRNVVGIHLGKNDSIISIVIRNKDIAKSFLATFDGMWALARPIA